MELIVITAEREMPGEAIQLNEMFAAGLGRLHVRRPAAGVWSLVRLLRRVPARYRKRLVLHSHYLLGFFFDVGGLHLPARVRCAHGVSARLARTVASCWRRWRGGTVSTSWHLEVDSRASGDFDYGFISPVFASLSKPGYQIEKALPKIAAFERGGIKIYALGGITIETLPRLRQMGFDGYAVLGAVWLAANPTAAFMELQQCARS